MTSSSRTLNVRNGPPLLSLVFALFDREGGGRDVEFTLQDISLDLHLNPSDPGIVLAHIHSVAKEGSSRDRWTISGVLYQTDADGLSWYPHLFRGTYNSRTRGGCFEVTEPVPGSVVLLTRAVLRNVKLRLQKEERLRVHEIEWPPLHLVRIR